MYQPVVPVPESRKPQGASPRPPPLAA